MDLLVNDLSVHQQFHDDASFHEALSRLMIMRSNIQSHGRELYCNRGFTNAQPIRDVPMQQAMGRLSRDRQRAVLSWLSHGGPFWDDVRKHGDGDYFEFNGDIVTDNAVGEAAFRFLNGMDCGLVSLSPSEWELSPVEVIWRRQAEELNDESAVLKNWWDAETLDRALSDMELPITSWDELRKVANQYQNLSFSKDCFSPLAGIPFSKASSRRFIFLFKTLNQLAGAYDKEIYREHFTGDRAAFSDSSDSEKNDFRQDLTFKDPKNPGHWLFCPWHGKESHLTLRLHFSWPIVAGKPVYVVYAGPKITKK